MSAYVLDKDSISKLARVTHLMLNLNNTYSGSYPLNDETVELLTRHGNNIHTLYSALFITNLKAVNGRYHEDVKVYPKYTPIKPFSIDNYALDELREGIELFGEYMYQISEDPVYKGKAYNAFYDIYKLLCLVYCKKMF